MKALFAGSCSSVKNLVILGNPPDGHHGVERIVLLIVKDGKPSTFSKT
jgi:hypothetical protein